MAKAKGSVVEAEVPVHESATQGRSRLPGGVGGLFDARLDQGVDRRASALANDNRGDVDGTDEISKVHGQRGEPRQGRGEGGNVRRRCAPDPVEQRTGVEPVDEPRGPYLVQG